MGESGSGKTTSMRNLPSNETFYIDCDGKGLSWKGWRNQYNVDNKNYWKTEYNSWYDLSPVRAEPYAVIAKSYELLSIRLQEQKEKYEKALREIRIFNHYIYGKDSL